MLEVEAILMRRLINTYLREADSSVGPARLRDGENGTGGELAKAALPFRVELPGTGRTLLARLSRASVGGHHAFAGPWRLLSEEQGLREIRDPLDLAGILCEEFASREEDPVAGDLRARQLLADIETSIRSVRIFASTPPRRPAPAVGDGAARAHVDAEQGIVFGHPFHPSAKSADPFDPADLEAFRPELGASFRLRYFALDPRFAVSDVLPGVGELLPPDAARELRVRLPAGKTDWVLLPCHPWQARLLSGDAGFRRLQAEGILLDLGPAGSPVFPTSSVRTVYAPEADLYLKLPLSVRITNFVRDNPAEHLERSLAASRALGHVLPDYRLGSLRILPELGYLGVTQEVSRESGGLDLEAALGVLARRGFGRGGEAPLVVAALVEPGEGGHPRLEALLERAAAARRATPGADFLCAWFRVYLEASLIPLLRLFCMHGLSLEAHAQNSLMAFKDGWPEALYVRDLEGTALSRQRAGQGIETAAGRGGRALFVEDAVAWQRFQYYVLVNHLGHLAACLADGGRVEEWQLWETARQTLVDHRAVFADLAAPGGPVDRLLASPTLPAKANFISRFRGHSEKPLYVSVLNPLCPEAACP